MKVISAEQDYRSIAVCADKVLEEGKALPDKIFRKPLKYFLFITFDELFMPIFFDHVKRYIEEVGENGFRLMALDPDPKEYFGSYFEFFGAFEFTGLDTEDEYLLALNEYPKDSPADALAHNSNSLMVFSLTSKWAIYGNRDADIAICAFADRAQMKLFELIYGSDLLGGVESAAEYAYSTSSETALMDRFCKNYATY